MSTKAITKVLRDMQCDYTPCLPGTCRKHEAQAELEAIRKAAKVIGSWPAVVLTVGASPDANAAAHSLMVAIAKESP